MAAVLLSMPTKKRAEADAAQMMKKIFWAKDTLPLHYPLSTRTRGLRTLEEFELTE